MVACCKQIEPKPSRRAQRCGEGRQSAQLRPRGDAGPTDRLAVPQWDDTLIPTVAQNAAQEPSLRSKQSTPSAGGRSARQPRAADLRVATDRVLVELAQIAFSNIGDVFDEHGAVIPYADLPPGIRSAIAEYRVRHGRNGMYVVGVRLHSKLAALAALGRHLGIFGCRPDRVTVAEGSSPTTRQGKAVTGFSTQPGGVPGAWPAFRPPGVAFRGAEGISRAPGRHNVARRLTVEGSTEPVQG